MCPRSPTHMGAHGLLLGTPRSPSSPLSSMHTPWLPGSPKSLCVTPPQPACRYDGTIGEPLGSSPHNFSAWGTHATVPWLARETTLGWPPPPLGLMRAEMQGGAHPHPHVWLQSVADRGILEALYSPVFALAQPKRPGWAGTMHGSSAAPLQDMQRDPGLQILAEPLAPCRHLSTGQGWSVDGHGGEKGWH